MAQRRQPRTEDHHAGGRGNGHVHGGIAHGAAAMRSQEHGIQHGHDDEATAEAEQHGRYPGEETKEQKQKVHGGNRIVMEQNLTI